MNGLNTGKKEIFEYMSPAKALTVMALPTVASQIIILLYNLADTWFIGKTNDPYKIAAATISLSVYMMVTALANVFGVGGGSLMVRLLGQKKPEEARKVASYSISASFLSVLVLSALIMIFMNPILRFLGATDNTILYARQYVFITTVVGGLPTLMSMSLPQLLRNAGYAREAGFGSIFGSVLNIILDPLFMFKVLPEGFEVLGAAVATMISAFCSMLYFVFVFDRVKKDTVLEIPVRIEKISSEHKRSLYSVGIPAAVSILFFNVVNITIGKIAVSYGELSLAAMGIVLKLERIPINTGLGICLGMVPLISYNYGARNIDRMRRVFTLSRNAVLLLSCVCLALFEIFAGPVLSAFIKEPETVRYGVMFLRGRCTALPFMMAGYLAVNFLNAVNRGKMSLFLAVVRHIILLIPILIVMNYLLGITGFIWAQLAGDIINTIIAVAILHKVQRDIEAEMVT